MAGNILAELMVKVKADTAEMRAALREAEGGAEDFSRSIQSHMTAAGAAITAFGVASAAALGMAVKAAAEEQAGIMRLSMAMRNVGLSYEASKNSLEGWFDSMQQATGFADDEMRSSMATIIRMTRDVAEAQDLVSLAMDVAVGTGTSLEQATMRLTYALSGNWGMLERYMPALKQAKDEEEKWMLLRQLFQGQAKAFGDTLAGEYARLKANISDIKETIGMALVPTVEMASSAINSFAQEIKSIPEPMMNIGVTAAAAVTALALFVGPTIIIVAQLPKLAAGLKTATAAMAAFRASLIGTLSLATVLAGALAALGYAIYQLTFGGGGGRKVIVEGAEGLWEWMKATYGAGESAEFYAEKLREWAQTQHDWNMSMDEAKQYITEWQASDMAKAAEAISDIATATADWRAENDALIASLESQAEAYAQTQKQAAEYMAGLQKEIELTRALKMAMEPRGTGLFEQMTEDLKKVGDYFNSIGWPHFVRESIELWKAGGPRPQLESGIREQIVGQLAQRAMSPYAEWSEWARDVGLQTLPLTIELDGHELGSAILPYLGGHYMARVHMGG